MDGIDQTTSPCCAPSRGEGPAVDSGVTVPPAGGEVPLDAVTLDGGDFIMGSDGPARWPSDKEGPARTVAVARFRISVHAVTNAQFAAFVDATDFVTDAQRFQVTFVFAGLLPDDFPDTRGVVGAEWWREVVGGDWAHPCGPQSSVVGLGNHPVVHVSHNDATAYCQWAGVRLPTEVEWEYAARGDLEQQQYPWGDEFEPNGQTMCNIFEGDFPHSNSSEDGYAGTAPVDAFPPNGFGLHNVAGNVWEWCADWFAPGSTRVIRGGSYLCHDSYCDRYRVAARSANAPDSSTGNMGFRVAADA
jgi:sulfatase modifying factor 1